MKANSWFGYSDVDHAIHRYIKVVSSLATFHYKRGRVITAYSCMSYRASRPNAAMLLNVGLVEALLKEQEEALSTVHRCHSQITRLLKEQAQHQITQQGTEQAAENTPGQGKRHKVNPTLQSEESDDDNYTQAFQQYELRDKALQQAANGQYPIHDPWHQQQMAMHGMTAVNPQDTVGQHQVLAPAPSTEAAPALPIPGLRAFHICPAEHLDGSGQCLMLLAYPRSFQAHCHCGHKQTAGNSLLVEFRFAGIQHFCITAIPNQVGYQRTAQQLGQQSHQAKNIAYRLALTSGRATATRGARLASVDYDIITQSEGNWCISSVQVFQSLAQLTWDEMVLAAARPDFKT